MALHGQVERCVGGMEVPHPGRPVGQPLDRHRAKHGLKRADMTALNPATGNPLIADDLLEALLSHRP